MNTYLAVAMIAASATIAACNASHQPTESELDAVSTEVPRGTTPDQPSTPATEAPTDSVSESELVGTSWALVEIDTDQMAVPDAEVTIRFEAGKISGSGGCNNYSGSFSLGDENPMSITIGPVAATRMACPDPVGGQEAAYFKALEGVSEWGYESGRLELYYAEAGTEALGRLLFAPRMDGELGLREELTGRSWQWVSFTGPVERFDVGTDETYTVTFNPDGTVAVIADCNNAGGSYTEDEGSLSIVMGPMTMAQCLPGSRSEQFVSLLGGSARYFFEGGKLYVDLMADGGTLTFAPFGD